MNVIHYEDKESWLYDRRSRITGSKLKDIVVKRGTGRKIGFYQLIADRLGIPADDENAMERGNRLESEAVTVFEKETGKEVDSSLQMWVRDDNDSIAYSPDGVIAKKEALEIKCLGSARHIEALITELVPDEYEFQKLQAFIVNDKLETLYFGFYDPRLIAKPFFYLTVKRSEVQEQVDEYLGYQKNILIDVEKYVKEFTF